MNPSSVFSFSENYCSETPIYYLQRRFPPLSQIWSAFGRKRKSSVACTSCYNVVSRPLTLQFFFGFLLFYTQRRETWCPGALLASAPLASAATLAANSVQVRLARISSSPSSEESEFDEMSRDAFLSTLEEEEERKSLEDGRRKVAFASPRSKRFVLLVLGQASSCLLW